jgi:bifunctional isochorismate lyase / aryl carrier protein
MLPAIDPYVLPTPAELPAGRVDWKVDPGRAALLVHDMQRHFVRPYAGAPLDAAVANMARLLDWARTSGMPVLFTAQPPDQHPSDRGLLTDFWGVGLTGEASAGVIEELAPADGDVLLTKWRYSAFQRTDLADRLGDRDQLVICGIYAHIGVQATALEAFMRDVQPFVVADAVADFSRSHHDGAMEFLAQRCARLVTTDGLTGPRADRRSPGRG